MIEACGADGLSSACWLAMRLKYSKARMSSWATPSPSAYIRPSFHCATGWPPSAAYCSDLSEDGSVATGTATVGTAAGGTGLFSDLAGPDEGATTPSGALWLTGELTGEPSNPNAGASGRAPR